MRKLRVGTTKIERENDDLVTSALSLRVTINSFLCLGRAKPQSSGEQLPGQAGTTPTLPEFEVRRLPLGSLCTSGIFSKKEKQIVSERRGAAARRRGGLCSEPTNHSFQLISVKFLLKSCPLLLGKS